MGARRCCGGSGEEGAAPARRYTEFRHATRKSWSCERRVIAKAEHLADMANPRSVVTSLPEDTFSARTVYERLYCRRGDAENTIKEQHLDLFSDRTSATCFAANQPRLLWQLQPQSRPPNRPKVPSHAPSAVARGASDPHFALNPELHE